MQAVRVLEFDAGHRVAQHESKCATLHGHRYKLEAYAEGVKAPLDSIGRVIDFSVIKKLLGGWIDDKWDHTTLVWEQDVVTARCLESMPQFKKPFLCKFNPTAENMADYLIKEICPEIFKDTGVEIVKLRLWETPNCYVEVTK